MRQPHRHSKLKKTYYKDFDLWLCCGKSIGASLLACRSLPNPLSYSLFPNTQRTGFHSVVANRAPIPRLATTGITPWPTALKCIAFATKGITHGQSALKFRLLTVAICGTIIFFVTIRCLNTVVFHDSRYIFECGLPQQSEIQYQPFNIDSPLVSCIIYFRQV
jgi:hypothetical protein